jgi:hypothetical protein
MLRVLIISAVFLLAGVPTLAQESHGAPDRKDCALFWTGHYENKNWGFEAEIPAGRKGYTNSPQAGCGNDAVLMGDHGLIIPLSNEPYEPERLIELFGAYNASEHATLVEVAEEELGWNRKHATAGAVTVVRQEKVKLDGVTALHVVVRYKDRELGRDTVEDRIDFFRGLGHKPPQYLYSFYLRTAALHYAEDRREFEQLMKTVHFRQPVM